MLSPAFVELVTREVTVNGLGAATDVLRAEHYALGWGKPGVASIASPASFGHGGATGTRLWVDPAHDLVFVYLSGVWEMAHAPINAVHDAVYAALPSRALQRAIDSTGCRWVNMVRHQRGMVARPLSAGQG